MTRTTSRRRSVTLAVAAALVAAACGSSSTTTTTGAAVPGGTGFQQNATAAGGVLVDAGNPGLGGRPVEVSTPNWNANLLDCAGGGWLGSGCVAGAVEAKTTPMADQITTTEVSAAQTYEACA